MGLFIYCCCSRFQWWLLLLSVAQLVRFGVGSGSSGSGGGDVGNGGNSGGGGSSKATRLDQYCTLHLPESSYLPHFIERYQDSYRYISVNNGTIHIRRGQLLLATCYGSSFRQLQTKMLEVYCPELVENVHTEMVIMHHGEKVNHAKMSPREALLCRQQVIGTYAVSLPCCARQGISQGFFSSTALNQTNFRNFVKLADFCYNAQQQQLQYAKYLLTTRDVRVEEQLKYNFDISGVDSINISHFVTHSNTFDHLLSQSKFFDKIRESFGGVAFGDEFVRTSLVPRQFFFSQFQAVSRESLAAAVQWAALNHGNWQASLNDLVALAQQKTALVYSGTSGKLFLSDYTGRLKQVFIKSELFSSHVVTIPFYFWLVVKTGGQVYPRGLEYESQLNESVAIIFINNPYLKNSDIQRAVFCDDICHKVPWLDQLLRTKDIPTLGTTFCCRVQDAVKFIPEIPDCNVHLDSTTLPVPVFNAPPTREVAVTAGYNRAPQEGAAEYLRAVYENFGRHPFEKFLSQFSGMNQLPVQQSSYTWPSDKKPPQMESKVQRDLSSFYAKTSVEVPPVQFRLPEGKLMQERA